MAASEWWGAGQPSATAVSGGRLLLFYSRGDSSSTAMLWHEADLSDAAHPILGPERLLPVAGLTNEGGGPDNLLQGAALAYDAVQDIFWLVRPGHPFPLDCPDWISDSLQIATLPSADLWTGGGAWTLRAEVTSGITNSHRIFDPGFIRNAFGGLANGSDPDVLVSTAGDCPDWLWSYRYHVVSDQGSRNRP